MKNIMDLFNTKKLKQMDDTLSKAIVELHDLRELKGHVIDCLQDDKAKLKHDIVKENRKKRPDNDKLFILQTELEIIGKVQNRIIDKYWGD